MKRAACAALFSRPRRSAFLVQEALQPLGSGWVAQLAQRLGLDLPYALARDVELLADLLQRVVGGHLDAEAHAQPLGLARRERVEHFFRHVAQAGEGRRVGGRERRLVLDEIAEVRVVVVADRRLHRDRLLGDLEDLADLLLGHLHARGERRRVRLLAGLLQDLAADAVHLVDGLDHVHRDADSARLVGDRARDRLPDPPRGIGRELVAAAVFELVDRLHQADVAFLDQVEELQPAVGVLLGDRDHQPQVGLGHLALGAARLRFAGRHLLVDLLQIADRDADLLLHRLDLAEQLEDRRLEAAQRLAPRLRRVDVAGQPAPRALGAGEDPDEVLARHLRLLDADVVDLALVAADLVDQAPHAVGKPLDGARGEADPHQLVGDLVARAQVVLVLRALVLQRLRHLVVEAADARELLERLAAQLQQARRLRGALVFLGFALFLLDLRLLVLGRLGLLRIEVVLGVGIDQAVDHLVDARLVLFDLAGELQDLTHPGRAGADRLDHVAQAFLDALGDLDLALAREQLDRAHLAHVHAHRVGGAAELGIHRGERGLGLLLHVLVGLRDGRGIGGDEQRFLVGRLVVDLDAHVAEGRDDGFDLLGVDQIVGQMVVDLRVREEAALLAELDQVLEARAPGLGVLFRHLGRDQPFVLRPRRPPRPPLPFALTSLTFASRSSSACLALLIGVFALALLSSGFGASAFTASAAFGAAALCARAGSLARSRFLTARDFGAETRFSVLRTFLAFFWPRGLSSPRTCASCGPSLPRDTTIYRINARKH